MFRLSLVSAVLLCVSLFHAASLAARHPAMSHDPKIGPPNSGIVGKVVSMGNDKSGHACPYQANLVCAGGGLFCDTNPAKSVPVSRSNGQGVD